VGGQELTALSEKELTRARRQIGMIFQHFNLLPPHSATCVALELDNTPKDEIKRRVPELLDLSVWGISTTAIRQSLRRSKTARGHCPCAGEQSKSCCATKPPAPWTGHHVRFWNC
jgi:ABC-type ATPase involved in cell division